MSAVAKHACVGAAALLSTGDSGMHCLVVGLSALSGVLPGSGWPAGASVSLSSALTRSGGSLFVVLMVVAGSLARGLLEPGNPALLSPGAPAVALGPAAASGPEQGLLDTVSSSPLEGCGFPSCPSPPRPLSGTDRALTKLSSSPDDSESCITRPADVRAALASLCFRYSSRRSCTVRRSSLTPLRDMGAGKCKLRL